MEYVKLGEYILIGCLPFNLIPKLLPGEFLCCLVFTTLTLAYSQEREYRQQKIKKVKKVAIQVSDGKKGKLFSNRGRERDLHSRTCSLVSFVGYLFSRLTIGEFRR
jgi:hypothetical protein